jgi:hypothetical protein
VTGKPDAELERMLSELQLGEFIYERAAISDIEYTFKHALTQEVAYNSVRIEHRRLSHERAAQSIEALHADRLEDHLAELAHHFDRSGNVAKAVEYLAAREPGPHSKLRTPRRTATSPGRSNCCDCCPDGIGRDSQELDLQMALSWLLFVGRGPRAPGRESALVRARELCEQLGDNARLMKALLGWRCVASTGATTHWRESWPRGCVPWLKEPRLRAMLAGAQVVLGFVGFGLGQFPSGA